MNKKIFTPLFVAASFALIACSTSEIVGRPNWINDPIVNDVTKDNTLKEIYDAIKKLGDTNANVLNKVMYDVAQKQIGHFEDVKNDKGEVIEVGLKTIANDSATNEQIDAFVEKYSMYKSDEKTYVLNDSGEAEEKEITEAADKRANSVTKIKAMYKRIYENIFEKLFNEIKGGSYSTKVEKYFEEDYFVQYLYKEMYYDDYDPTTTPSLLAHDRVFIPKKPGDDWSTYVNTSLPNPGESGFLHVDQDGKGNWYGYYKEYINRKLLPEIYRTLLIERYVREQRATNLGRSYARKVNIITVPYNSNAQVNIHINTMLTNFATSSIITPQQPATDFELIKDAMVGFAAESPTVSNMLSAAKFDTLKVSEKDFYWGIRTDTRGLKVDNPTNSTKVYRGTKLYDIVEKYFKVMNVSIKSGVETPSKWDDFDYSQKTHLTSDEQAALDDLTNKGAYTIEKGLELKEREIRQTDMTQDGWFLKDGGLTDLNEKFRNKLFNITTSNIIDNEVLNDTPDVGDTVRYFGSKNPDPITGTYKNRKAYVFDPQAEGAASVVLDDGSANYYIVEVEEAASASKLSTTDVDSTYLKLKATKAYDGHPLGDANETTNEIFSKVTEQVANSDTYKKNAEQYYLMISNILFYDQSVYDYFKSQFPELFK